MIWLAGFMLALAATPANPAFAASPADTMQLQVAGLAPGAPLPPTQAYDRGGCHGANRSPQMSWSHAPAKTASYAVTVFDRDARGGKGFWHWVVWNLPASSDDLPDNAAQHLPQGARESRNDYGSQGYGGPCPPSGPAHHYVVTVYALPDASLSIPAQTRPANAARRIRARALAHASQSFRYQRRQAR